MLLADIAHEAGIPDGVLNVVNGLGPTVGAALTEHPLVKKVVFTGGTEPGRSIAVAAAQRFAKTTLELGGKSPVLFFDDTPVDVAARGAAFGGFIGAGQTCIAGSRLLVQRRHPRRVRRRPGRGGREHPHRRPRRGRHPARAGHLRHAPATGSSAASPRASRDGARVVTGGRAAEVPGLEDGFFVEPTVLADVTNDMAWPARRSSAPSSWSSPSTTRTRRWRSPTTRRTRSARRSGPATSPARTASPARLEAGMVWVNDHHRLDPSSPWGGLKESGTGREGGWESFHDFTQVRAVTVRTAPDDVDWYGGKATGRLN